MSSISKYALNHVPASGAGLKADDRPHVASYRAAEVSEVPSDWMWLVILLKMLKHLFALTSPPGLTQTKASAWLLPVDRLTRIGKNSRGDSFDCRPPGTVRAYCLAASALFRCPRSARPCSCPFPLYRSPPPAVDLAFLNSPNFFRRATRSAVIA